MLEWDFRNREEIDWDLEEVFEDPAILKNWIWKVLGITKDYFLADPQIHAVDEEFVNIVFEVNHPHSTARERTTIQMPTRDINFASINNMNSRKRSSRKFFIGGKKNSIGDKPVDDLYKNWPPSNNFENSPPTPHKLVTPDRAHGKFDQPNEVSGPGHGSEFLDQFTSRDLYDSGLKSSLRARGHESERKRYSVSMDIDITPIAQPDSHESGFGSSPNIGHNIDLLLVPIQNESAEM